MIFKQGGKRGTPKKVRVRYSTRTPESRFLPSCLQVSVKCNYSQNKTSTKKDGKIQLSNFQKYLCSTNCSHIKAIKK